MRNGKWGMENREQEILYEKKGFRILRQGVGR